MKCISPFDLTINQTKATISASSFHFDDENKDNQYIFRLFGRISCLIDSPLVKSSFKSSLIASADAIISYVPRVRLYLRTILEVESEKSVQFTEKAKEFSTMSENSDSTQELINKLINSSLDVNEKVFLPWI